MTTPEVVEKVAIEVYGCARECDSCSASGGCHNMIKRTIEAYEKAREPVWNSVVIEQAEKYADYWQDKDDSYWLARLMQEVGELGSAIVGDHEDTPEHELSQIASIALNWLRKRGPLNPPKGE